MKGGKLHLAFGLLGTLAVFVAAALPVQGAAAISPKLEPASNAIQSAAPNPSPSPAMPARTPTGSKSSSPSALTAGGTWTWQNPMPEGNPLNAVSCPTTTTCFAASSDGRVLTTTYGNAPWNAQTTGATAPLNAIACITTTTCVAVGDSGAMVRTSDGGANWTKAFISGGGWLGGISCPTALVCYAVGTGSSIYKSTDGGATWASQGSATGPDLFGISCSTTTNCVAAGAKVITSTIDGSIWNGMTSVETFYGVACPGGCLVVGKNGAIMAQSGASWTSGNVGVTVTLTSVSCPSSAACYITGVDGSVYFRGGISNWSTPAPRGATGADGALDGISCPTTSTCFAVGEYGAIVNTTVSGTTWTQQTASPNNALYGISCPSTTVCFAVGTAGAIASTANGGTVWSVKSSGNAQTLLSVSCLSTTVCFAVGNGGTVIATTDGGTSWTIQTSNTTQPLQSISCVISTTTCFAVTNGASYIKTTNGTSWSTPAPAGAALGLTAISCPTTTTCFATDSDNPTTNLVYSTTDGGATWARSFNVANDPQAGINARFAAITCPNTANCYAVGASGLIAVTSDGGTNWRTAFADSSAALTGVSCISAAYCSVSALDSTILHTGDAGGSWDVLMGFHPYTAISCPSTTCFAVDQLGNAATTNGAAPWNIQRPSGPTHVVRGLSCPSNNDCYAVSGNTIHVTHNGGASWSANLLRTTDLLRAISCPYATICFAVGWPGAIYRTGDGGTTWTLQPHSLYGSDNTFGGVSCARPWQCVVVGTQGKILFTTNDGNTWAAETSGTTQYLSGVNCPDDYSCIAVGYQGLTLTRSGGSWQAYPSGTTKNLKGVSCPSISVCYAVGNSGTVLNTQNRGANWTAQTSGTVNDLYGISCPRTTACLAVGDFGSVGLTVDGSTWSGVRTPTGNGLRSVAFTDLNHAWVGGFGGTILGNPNITAACATVAVSGNPPTGAVVGTQVTFTATSTGCPNPRYEFWLRGYLSNTWQLVQAYSPSATYLWNSSGAQPGYAYIGIWARDATSSADSDSLASIAYAVYPPQPCSSVTESASPPSPSSAGTQVTFTANATCPNPNPLYAFWAKWQGDPNWYPLQGYSTSNSYRWNSTGAAAGTEYIGVWAKDAGSSTGTFDANTSIPYSVTTPTCTNLTVSATPTTVVHGSGTHVSVTGAAMCSGPNPRYEFWLRTTNTDWQLVQAYSASGTYDWNSTGAPVTTVYIGVWAKEAGSSTTTFDVNQSVAIPVT